MLFIKKKVRFIEVHGSFDPSYYAGAFGIYLKT